MNAVCNTIVSRGLAEEDQIFFVSGRGGMLNSTLKSNNVAAGYNFKIYGPASSNGYGGASTGSTIFPTEDNNGL